MAQEDHNVRMGDISTYENASDEFLKRRKEDLRADMRNPRLSSNEYFTDVFTRTFVAAGVVMWSTWNGLWSLFTQNRWINKHLRAGNNRYIHDVQEFRAWMADITENIGKFVAGETENRKSVTEVIDKILAPNENFTPQAGRQELEALRVEILANPKMAAQEQEQRLLNTLSGIRANNESAATGQFATLWEEMQRLKEQEPKAAGERLGGRAMNNMRDQIINKVAIQDNVRLINRVRYPAMAVAVIGAAALTEWQGRKAAKTQKGLQQESELTHIERLERERRRSKAGLADFTIAGANAGTIGAERY